MEFSEKYCIGFMIAYKYGDYAYLKNENNAPEEHHIQSIFKTRKYLYNIIAKVDVRTIEIFA